MAPEYSKSTCFPFRALHSLHYLRLQLAYTTTVFRIRTQMNPDSAKNLNPDPEDPWIRIRILANFKILDLF